MKIDGGLGGGLSGAGAAARDAEEAGYDGVWSAETAHDPFFPLLLAAEHTEHVELGTGIAVAFARNPMNLANIAYDLQAYSRGPVHPRARLARSSRTSPSASPWSGRTRRRGCGR